MDCNFVRLTLGSSNFRVINNLQLMLRKISGERNSDTLVRQIFAKNLTVFSRTQREFYPTIFKCSRICSDKSVRVPIALQICLNYR